MIYLKIAEITKSVTTVPHLVFNHRAYLSSFDNDHLGLLSVMTGYDAPQETSFDIFWIVLFSLFTGATLLGLFSIAIKKYREQTRQEQVLPVVNIPPSIEQANNGQFQINNIAFNKPLLSTLSLSVAMITLICIIGGSIALAYFTLNFSLRELNVTYAVLLSYSIIDFVFPLLYGWWNKDYRNQVQLALKDTINSIF